VYLLDLSSVQDLATAEVRRRRKNELEQPSVPPLRRARDSAGLIRILTDLLRPPDVRCEAARALAEVGGEAAISPLLAQLRDPIAQIRACSRASLARMGAPAVPALMPLLHDADPDVRQEAAKALATMRPPATSPINPAAAQDANQPD
jgi:HEAT repeat protein